MAWKIRRILLMKKKSKKNEYHALDVYIVFCFICIIAYTAVNTYIFYQTGTEASVLDALFYGVFGGEVLLCALLKRLKLKHEYELKKLGRNDQSVFSGNIENTFTEE